MDSTYKQKNDGPKKGYQNARILVADGKWEWKSKGNKHARVGRPYQTKNKPKKPLITFKGKTWRIDNLPIPLGCAGGRRKASLEKFTVGSLLYAGTLRWALPRWLSGKECDCQCGRHRRDMGLIPWLGKSPGERNSNLLQYSCLGNSMDRGACRAKYSPWRHRES